MDVVTPWTVRSTTLETLAMVHGTKQNERVSELTPYFLISPDRESRTRNRTAGDGL